MFRHPANNILKIRNSSFTLSDIRVDSIETKQVLLYLTQLISMISLRHSPWRSNSLLPRWLLVLWLALAKR